MRNHTNSKCGNGFGPGTSRTDALPQFSFHLFYRKKITNSDSDGDSVYFIVTSAKTNLTITCFGNCTELGLRTKLT